jgi:hypothetical protein
MRTYEQLFRNHIYIHATIAGCPALLEHTTSSEELFRMDATIDRIGYKMKATVNFAAEARKQDNELGLGV